MRRLIVAMVGFVTFVFSLSALEPDGVATIAYGGKHSPEAGQAMRVQLWRGLDGLLSRIHTEGPSGSFVNDTTISSTDGRLSFGLSEDNEERTVRASWSDHEISWEIISGQTQSATADSQKIQVFGPEGVVLVTRSKEMTWNDAGLYYEQSRPVETGLTKPMHYVRQGAYVTEWVGTNVNGRFVFRPTPKGYEASYQQQMDWGAPWDERGKLTYQGKPLHSKNKMTNILNFLILQQLFNENVIFLPSLLGWDLK